MEGHNSPLQLYLRELGGTQDLSREEKDLYLKVAVC